MPFESATAALAEALHDVESALDQLAAERASAEDQASLIQEAASALAEAQRELERIEADLAAKQKRLDGQLAADGAVVFAVAAAQAALDADEGAIGDAAFTAVEVAILRELAGDSTIDAVSAADRIRLDGLYDSVAAASAAMGGLAAAADATEVERENAEAEFEIARSIEVAEAAKLEVAYGELSDFSRRIADAMDLTLDHLEGASAALLEDQPWEAVVLLADAKQYRSALEGDVVEPVDGLTLGVNTADVLDTASTAWEGVLDTFSAAAGERFERQAEYREAVTADARADGDAAAWAATRIDRIAQLLEEAAAEPVPEPEPEPDPGP